MRKVSLVLAVLSMVLAATTYSLWRDRENERERADALVARITALESRHPTSAASRATPAEVPPLAASAVPDAPAPKVSPDSLGVPAEEFDDYRAVRRRLLRDPKYYEAARASLRLSFANRRDEVIRALGIPRAKADAIVEYWIDNQLRLDAIDHHPRQTEEELGQHAEKLVRQQREGDENLRGLVGDETFAKLQEYTASRPSRNRANQLRTRLAVSNQELREDQFDPLVAVLHTEQVRHQQEVQDYLGTREPDDASPEAQRRTLLQMSDLSKASSRRLHGSAAAILSPQQLAVFDALLREEFEGMQLQSTLSLMESSASEN